MKVPRKIWMWTGLVWVALSLNSEVRACSCLPTLGFCQKLPEGGDDKQAIFVGRVEEFFPKSRGEFEDAFGPFRFSGRPLARRVDGPSEPPVLSRPEDLEKKRTALLRFWGDRLSPAERGQIAGATSTEQLVFKVPDFSHARRARFRVLENLVSARTAEFAALTAADGPMCGIDFVEGEIYLVVARREADDAPWTVSYCSRTRPAQQAEEDLRVLRAWRNGQRLPGRIAGQVLQGKHQTNLGGIPVHLIGGPQIVTALTGTSGEFVFENLNPGRYDLEVTLPGGKQRRNVDLTSAWCGQAFFRLEP